MRTQKKLIEREQFSQAFNESDLNSWDFHYKKIKESLDGCEEEKQAIIRRRILRYFGQFKLESENFFSIRMEIESTPFLQIIPDQILLYGIDYLSIQRARQYFAGYLIKVKRVDDSHFLIQFNTQQQCFHALQHKMKRDQLILPINSPFELFRKSQDKGWVELVPYKEFIFERKLMARYLTNFDRIQQKSIGSRSSVYYAYSEAKRKFLKSLKQSLFDKCSHKQDQPDKSRKRSHSKDHHQRNDGQYQNPVLCQYRRCCCHCNCKKNRKRDRERSNSRESMRSSSANSQGSVDSVSRQIKRREQSLTIYEKKKLEDSEYKFQLYLENRKKLNQNQQNPSTSTDSSSHSTQQQLKISPLKSGSQNISLTTKHDSKIHQKHIEQSVIINPHLNYQNQVQISMIGKGPGQSKHKLVNQDYHEQDSMNFEMYLQRLKLEDSHQYSAFDIDLNND